MEGVHGFKTKIHRIALMMALMYVTGAIVTENVFRKIITACFNDTSYSSVAFVVILVSGLIKIRRSINALIHRHNFVNEFRQKFIQFANPYAQQQQRFYNMEQAVQPDAQLYHYLVSNMDKTQRLLGIYGLGLYTAPFHP